MPVTIPRLLLLSSAFVIAGCGGRTDPALPMSAPVLPVESLSREAPASGVGTLADPAVAALERAEAEFARGQAQLEAGHVVTARMHFDNAVDQLLALPLGARGTPATSAAFDRLLDRITALELLALRDGDGLAETRTEPAAIDELLRVATFERPAPAATTADTVRADLDRTPISIGVTANDRVLSFVELFQGRLHDFIVEGLARSHRYLPMMRQIFAEEEVPEELVYVPLVESAFKSNALSRASARGLWQFMPATGREFGLQQTFFIDERSHPEKSTRAAARYLKVLHGMFDGDWSLALAAYNAGPGRVQGAIRRSGVRDFWRLTSSSRYLPRETRDYVPMIMAAMVIARNPQLYGFDEIDLVAPFAYETVQVPGAIDLKIIAEWANVTVDELRTLNPELRRTTTPNGTHDLRVPAGTAASVERQIASADALFVQFTHHTVRRGETLSAIGRRYHVSVAELREANNLGTRAILRINQTLLIPQRSAQGLPVPVAVTASAESQPPSPLTYRVRRGDTLYGIARRFDTTVDAIKRLNQLRTNRINIGDRLTVR